MNLKKVLLRAAWYLIHRTRHMLVYMIGMRLDILENCPDVSSFHLDSQTVPIQGCIEIRPEKEETMKKLLAEEAFCKFRTSMFDYSKARGL